MNFIIKFKEFSHEVIKFIILIENFYNLLSNPVNSKSGTVANVGQGSSRVFVLWPGLPKSRSAQERSNLEDENCFKRFLFKTISLHK